SASLSPAKVLRVDVNEATKEAVAIVPEDQLSLAIGKRGQNVRLAAKLTGWKIDINGAENKGEEKNIEKEESVSEEISAEVESPKESAEENV
ncbi:MAG: transcription termination/antitermination protein NusA, partial [Candidatus Pacebacteria bacterium]|nr:transcription termination/antitermination protein NusA [Candidatus Paceibacterota bacterium]